MMIRFPWLNHFARRRGFSAVEIIAVATIIAILSLILIPMLRTRVEDSKLIAAKDELNQIHLITTLCYADTGKWFRLQDYDNALPQLDATTTTVVPPWESYCFWGQKYYFSVADYNRCRVNWKGPYTSFQKTISIDDLRTNFGAIFSTLSQNAGGTLDIKGGPIFFSDETSQVDEVKEGNQQYPVDPWGNPYLFFAPGKLGIQGVSALDESDYRSPVIYSMGPDGVPGSYIVPNPGNIPVPSEPPVPQDYLRRKDGPLGLGDDLVRQF